jgi:hypothetical protein
MGMSYNWISTLITIYIRDTSNYLVDTTLCDKFVRYLRQVVGFSIVHYFIATSVFSNVYFTQSHMHGYVSQ